MDLEALENEAVRELLRGGIKSAMEWLGGLIRRGRMEQRQQENLESFLGPLVRRVSALEASLTPGQRAVFDAALDDPSTALLIHKSIITASTMPADDRHELLATMILQRFRCGGDDLVALAGQAACDLIQSLAPRHIHFLALAVGLRVQPKGCTAWDDAKKAEFWRGRLPTLLAPDIDSVTSFDIGHLVSLGAVRITPYADASLGDLLQFAETRGLPSNIRVLGRLESDPWWPRLHRVWSFNMQDMLLGSTGFMIGALHHDRVLAVTTDLGWR